MRKVLSWFRQAPKRTSALLAIMTAVLVVPAMLNAWGPDRQTFTIEKPATYVEFNSITNNPNIGDERNFVGIRENGTNGLWQDNVKVQAGKEYVVRMYVHNNAAENLKLVAEDVNAMFYLPNTSAKSHQVNGFLRSSNAKTKEIYDHATFTGDQDFKLAYVAGSAKYYNNANGNGFTIPESLFTSKGATLGYDKMDGKIPGCFQYAGYLTFIVRPQLPETPKPDFSVAKDVRKVGGTFAESVAVQPGDTVNYRIQFKNTGTTQLNNVILKDTLPKGVSFVPGTVKILNASNPSGVFVKDGDKLFSTGINIGNYTAGSNAIVVFDAKVAAKTALECGAKTLKNIASAQPEGLQPKTDGADVTTNVECPPAPIYTCDSLTVNTIERTKFQFEAKYTVKNATYKSTTYVVKDANGKEVYRGTNATYTQTTVGKYTVEAYVTVTVGGKDFTTLVGNCKASFEVKPAPVVPVYTCDALTVKTIERTKFQFSVAHTAKNAVLKTTTYVVKDASGKEVYRGTNATYTQTKVGVYSVEALLTFTVDGKDVTLPAGKCKASFEVKPAPVTPVPGVEITKTVNGVKSAVVEKDKPFVYTLVVKNTGNVVLKNVKVQDAAPKGVTFQKADKGVITNNVWTHTISELKVGASETVKITAVVANYFDGAIKNTACVNAPEVNPTKPNDSDDCDDADITIVKPEEPKTIEVCRLEDKKYPVTIKDNEFDSTKHSMSAEDCKTTPVTPPTPTELPQTGATDSFLNALGLGALVTATLAYVASRRNSLIG